MATRKTSDDFEAKAEALRKAAALADDRAEELSDQEELKDSIEFAAAEAEAIAHVYAILRNLNNSQVQSRVLDYVGTKLNLFVAPALTNNELTRLRTELAVKNGKAQAAIDSQNAQQWVKNFMLTPNMYPTGAAVYNGYAQKGL